MVTEEAGPIPKIKIMKIKKNKMKKSKKKLKKGLENQDSESEIDNLDLSQKLYPLSHYVSDQEELVNQMLATIRGSKLEAMLPPVLRSIPLKELKKLCLHELRGMSKKRILCCINGVVMEGSSGSEEDEEEEKAEEHLTNEETSTQDNTTRDEKRKCNEQTPEAFLLKKIKVEPGLEDTTEGQSPDTGKSVLELLELEMRARIIKTMLEKGDEGKKIAEDAIAAVMQSAKQITKEGNQMMSEIETVGVEGEAVMADAKDNLQQKVIGDEVSNEGRKGERVSISKDGRSSRRRHHRSRGDERRKDMRRGRDKRDRSHSDKSDCGHGKRSKERTNSDRHVQKKKKITRKEFEERMKRAKKNRTYRQRKPSEDEEKAKEKDEPEPKIDEINKDQEKGEVESSKGDAEGGEASQSKPTVEAVGEVSEKEEGELDSNEEEEGACTPSDVSSASSYYSSSPSSWKKSYSSRSRSKSYSRSRSRSPGKRRRRRSYTRSRTKSKSQERKSKNDGKRYYERMKKEPVKGDSIGKRSTAKVPPVNPKDNKEEEENWGQKCDIEFVDSEEDFDDNPDIVKETVGTKPPSVVKGQVIERASISFSFQRKPGPNIAPSVDLDDLPLKQARNNKRVDEISSEIGITAVTTSNKKATEEIVISSDSESEKQIMSVTASSTRNKRVVEIPKQINPKQTHPLRKRNSVTKLQPKSKIQEDMENKTKGYVADCLATERQDQIIDSEALKKLKKDDIGVKVSNTKVHKQKQNKLKVDIEKTGESQRTMQEPKVHNEAAGKIQMKIQAGDKGALDVAKISNDDTHTQLGGLMSMEVKCYEETVLKDSDKLNNFQIMENPDVATINEQVKHGDAVISQSCTLEVMPELSHSISKLISKEENHNLDNINNTSKDETTMDGAKEVCEAYNKSITQDDDLCDYGMICEASKDHVAKIDNEGPEQQEVALEMHESVSLVKVMEKSLNQDQNNVEGLEDRMSEATPDSLSKGCIAQEMQEIDKSGSNTSEQCLLTELEKLTVCEDDDDGKMETSVNIEDSKDEQFTEDCYDEEEHLALSEDDKHSDMDNIKQYVKDDIPVEPIRIETGLIRKRVLRQQKVEMTVPGISWTKRERKKKEKSRDTLVMEGIGFLKKSLSENAQSSPLRENEEASLETNRSSERLEMEETVSSGVASASETDNSLLAEDNAPTSSNLQSPKDTRGPSPDVASYEEYEPKSDEKIQKKIGQETEIIGVIETSKDSSSDTFDDIELGGSSWSMRWLQSEKVQKVVTSSKMLSRVRKKFQKREKATKVVTEKVEEPQKKTSEPFVPVIGSIEEYERLFGMTIKKDAEEASNSPSPALQVTVGQVEQTSQPIAEQDNVSDPSKVVPCTVVPTFGSDDEGEDSEEEALWSKILGKR
ncbi:axoneme-associated protein mst101(2) [Procambarus clarkii]|uniref:axoneme-associated protein mst101(2) n=1 Tax=Procambarus clarkii TaxID=6728 RepID=UPI001E670BDF|nr:uncharacterized protein LOC123767717 [Procambarus clarkii]XP_045613613.1 uncharacterized protein LOC123767717 [Procambarus clarkii]XP_045613614.1 uncharacterized protein LOC123767717 [Procambarus clarkii]